MMIEEFLKTNELINKKLFQEYAMMMTKVS